MPLNLGNILQQLAQQESAPQPDHSEFLQRLFGGEQPINVLQQAQLPQDAPQPAQIPQQVQQPQQAPRTRRSFLDTLGGISDVLARVGGAEAMYQPTLDARHDREMADQFNTQKLTLGNFEVGDKGNQRAAQALLGLKAIQKGGGDINTAWPLLAQNAGIPADRAAQLADIFGQHPEALDGVIASLGGQQSQEFGLQPFFAQDDSGNLVAYQLGKDGNVHKVALPEGQSPIDPMKFIDVGNAQVGVGERSGAPRRILPKGEAPGKLADRESRERIAGRNNRTAITIAGMPARGGGKTGEDARSPVAFQGALDILDQMDNAVSRMASAGSINAPGQTPKQRIGATAMETVPFLERVTNPEGYTARQDLNRLRARAVTEIVPLLSSIKIGGKNIDSAAEAKRFDNMFSNVTDAASARRASNEARQRIQYLMSHADKPAAPRPSRSITPRRAAGKPTVSNW